MEKLLPKIQTYRRNRRSGHGAEGGGGTTLTLDSGSSSAIHSTTDGETLTLDARDIAASGARPLGSTPHPQVRGIYKNSYQPRKQAGSQGQGGVRLGGRYGKAETKTVVDTAIRSVQLDLSHFHSAPGAHLSGLPFKSQGAFPA